MITLADSLSFTKVNSEFEALLLETKLIRKYMPKYNSASKDDKHPLYITITKEEFPRVITTRKDGTFGPFPSSNNVREVLKMIRRIFPYADHKVGSRACLYSQLGLCDPCPSIIRTNKDKLKYLSNIRKIKSILNGKISVVKKDLEKEMDKLAKAEEFESANKAKRQLEKLEYITTPRVSVELYLENPNLTEDLRSEELEEIAAIVKVKKLRRIECYDISHLGGTKATASMVVFIEGEADKSEYRHFKIRQKKGQSDYDSIREVAKRRKKNNWDKADLIIIDGGIGQVKAFETDIPKVGIAKNPDRLIIGEDKLRLKGPAANLITRIRDEAHRFAQRYHHKLMSLSLK